MRSSRKDPEHSEEEETDGVAAVLGKAGRGSRRERGGRQPGGVIREGGEDDTEAAEGRAGSAEPWGRKDGSERISRPDPGASAAGAPRSRRPRTHAPAGIPRGRPRRGRHRGDPAAPGPRREAEPAGRPLDRLATRTPRPERRSAGRPGGSRAAGPGPGARHRHSRRSRRPPHG